MTVTGMNRVIYGAGRTVRLPAWLQRHVGVDLGESQLDEHLEQTCVVVMPLGEHSGLGVGCRAFRALVGILQPLASKSSRQPWTAGFTDAWSHCRLVAGSRS